MKKGDTVKRYKLIMGIGNEWIETIAKPKSFTVGEGKKELKLKYPAAIINYIKQNRSQKF